MPTVDLWSVASFLSPVRRVNPHVLCSEITGPVGRLGWTGMQVDDDGHVLREEPVGRGALVEIQRLPAPQNLEARHGDLHERGIELYSGTPGGGKDAAPVGIAARESSLHKGRSGNRFRDAPRGRSRPGTAHLDLDHAPR